MYGDNSYCICYCSNPSEVFNQVFIQLGCDVIKPTLTQRCRERTINFHNTAGFKGVQLSLSPSPWLCRLEDLIFHTKHLLRCNYSYFPISFLLGKNIYHRHHHHHHRDLQFLKNLIIDIKIIYLFIHSFIGIYPWGYGFIRTIRRAYAKYLYTFPFCRTSNPTNRVSERKSRIVKAVRSSCSTTSRKRSTGFTIVVSNNAHSSGCK